MTKQTGQEWTPCRAGELAGVLDHVRSTKRRRITVRLATVSTVLLLASAGGWWIAGPSQNAPADEVRVNCSKVKELAPDFLAHRLDESLQQLIQRHLDACPRCERHVEGLKARQHQDLRQPPLHVEHAEAAAGLANAAFHDDSRLLAHGF